jgi:hypothetical protein
MPPFDHSASARAWRVVTPNTPICAADSAAAAVPLQFLSVPHVRARETAAAGNGVDETALLQSAGPIFVEIPCAHDLKKQPQLLSFAALRRA